MINSVVRSDAVKKFIGLGLVLSFQLICSCTNSNPRDINNILEETGDKRQVFETVIDHYKNQGEAQKVAAVYFLVRQMKDHFYYDPSYLAYYRNVLLNSNDQGDKKTYIINKFDSLNKIYGNRIQEKIPDYESLTSEMLIENIDYAFHAWQLPWAKDLSFTEFCEYILPYKVNTEKPTLWRKKLYDQLSWVVDSFKNEKDRRKICSIINDQLHWFKFQWPFSYPTVQDFDCMIAGKTGKCSDATTLTIYAMRALGIPATVDFTPQWANRNYGHHWNALLYKDDRFINFQGTEANPGSTKIEYDPNEEWTFKRAKIYRTTFSNFGKNEELLQAIQFVPATFEDKFYLDVTADFVPVSDLKIDLLNNMEKVSPKYLYLCVFNNQNWIPVDWGHVKNGTAVFKNAGRGVLYIGTLAGPETMDIATKPFLLLENGDVQYLQAGKDRLEAVKLFRKYPYNNSNTIKTNDMYELFYWDEGWKSLGRKKATGKFLVYDNIPINALLLLKDLDRGKQERPFTIERGLQKFW